MLSDAELASIAYLREWRANNTLCGGLHSQTEREIDLAVMNLLAAVQQAEAAMETVALIERLAKELWVIHIEEDGLPNSWMAYGECFPSSGESVSSPSDCPTLLAALQALAAQVQDTA